jgi:hypothetical protein
MSASPMIEGWTAARETGQRVAFEVLVPGSVFRGAMAEARASGFAPGTVEGQCFMRGFIDGLTAIYGMNGVTIDTRGVIQEVV